jgi:hypothetical protein
MYPRVIKQNIMFNKIKGDANISIVVPITSRMLSSINNRKGLS